MFLLSTFSYLPLLFQGYWCWLFLIPTSFSILSITGLAILGGPSAIFLLTNSETPRSPVPSSPICPPTHLLLILQSRVRSIRGVEKNSEVRLKFEFKGEVRSIFLPGCFPPKKKKKKLQERQPALTTNNELEARRRQSSSHNPRDKKDIKMSGLKLNMPVSVVW